MSKYFSSRLSTYFDDSKNIWHSIEIRTRIFLTNKTSKEYIKLIIHGGKFCYFFLYGPEFYRKWMNKK